MDSYKRSTTGRDAGRGNAPVGRFSDGENRARGERAAREEGEKGGIRSYRELRVYQAALDAALEAFAAIRTFPAEQGGLHEPMRQTAISLCVRLGEAWRRRRTAAQFVDKLAEAESDAAGMRVCVELATRCGFIPPESARDLDERYDKILGQLFRMISEPEQWTIRKEAS